MDFRFGLLLFISAQICTTFASPPCICGRHLDPVCGSDGVEYANSCILECAAYTTGKQITIAKYGKCEDSLPRVAGLDCVCPLIYNPVCGSDGKTYANECMLDCAKKNGNPSLKVDHVGPCKEEPVLACPAIYMPVCGSDGKTYSNSCVLNARSVKDPSLSVAHDGPC